MEEGKIAGVVKEGRGIEEAKCRQNKGERDEGRREKRKRNEERMER